MRLLFLLLLLPLLTPALPSPPRLRLSRRAALTAAAAAALAPPQAAHAAYGAARGAVTSLPQTAFDKLSTKEQLDELSSLGGVKRAQQVSVLSERQIDVLLAELRERQAAISARISEDLAASISSGEQNRKLRSSLAKAREELEAVRAELTRVKAERKEAAEGREAPPSAPAGERRLASEAEELALQIKRLEGELAELEVAEARTGKLREQELRALREELAQQRGVRDSLLKRNTLLEALDAQPEWFNYLAAFLASCVSTLVMHPVDTIKTRMIASAARPPPPPAGWSAAAAHASVRPAERIDPSPPAGHEPYLEPSVSAKATTVAEAEHADGEPLHLPSHAARGEEAPRQNLGEGLLSLYQGLPGALLKEGPPSALYLGVYEAVKTRLLVNPLFEPYPILVYLIAGAAGETIGSVVRAPSENIKARVQSGADASTGEAVRSVLLSAKGRENVVRAWSSSLIRDVPFGAIQLAIFEGLKSFLIDSTSIDSTVVDSLASEAVLGAIGGSVGALSESSRSPQAVTRRRHLLGRSRWRSGYGQRVGSAPSGPAGKRGQSTGHPRLASSSLATARFASSRCPRASSPSGASTAPTTWFICTLPGNSSSLHSFQPLTDVLLKP